MGGKLREHEGSPQEVFAVFLKLGLTSFGGPVAHLGYFRQELVVRRQWLSEKTYGDLMALCQFLPGPASSQLGFALGLHRAGALGALAAWTAFTLPSALALLLFALSVHALDGTFAQGVVHGLKLVAVAVVAQAVYGMARSLTPDLPRLGIAALAIAALLLIGGVFGQMLAIALGGALGLLFLRKQPNSTAEALPDLLSKRLALGALALFTVLLLGLPLLTGLGQGFALFDSFYRAGALVFGGGHVVLPLLQAETVGQGWLSEDVFLAGYGATQAVPGPLFTFAAFLGAQTVLPPNGLLGAAIALIAIFLPGMLLLLAALPFWSGLAAQPKARAAMAGANAAVVGVLAAALYHPVITSAIFDGKDLALAVAAIVLLVLAKWPSWVIVIGLSLGAGLIAVL